MKLLLFLLIPILFSSCAPRPEALIKADINRQFLEGKHQLQRIYSGNETNAAFFLFGGGSINSKQTVSFSWKSDWDGIYNFTTIRLDRLRVKIVEGKVPTIEFQLDDLLYFDYPEDIGIVNYYINSVIVECDSKYWGLNIKLPGNEQK